VSFCKARNRTDPMARRFFYRKLPRKSGSGHAMARPLQKSTSAGKLIPFIYRHPERRRRTIRLRARIDVRASCWATVRWEIGCRIFGSSRAFSSAVLMARLSKHLRYPYRVVCHHSYPKLTSSDFRFTLLLIDKIRLCACCGGSSRPTFPRQPNAVFAVMLWRKSAWWKLMMAGFAMKMSVRSSGTIPTGRVAIWVRTLVAALPLSMHDEKCDDRNHNGRASLEDVRPTQ
jgi:hypothetical protein